MKESNCENNRKNPPIQNIMSSSDYSLIRVVHSSSGIADEWFTLRIASEMSGMHPGIIREFARARLVESFGPVPGGNGELFFDSGGIRRLQQIHQLRQRQHVNLRTIRMIVRLLDQLDNAELELRVLREELR